MSQDTELPGSPAPEKGLSDSGVIAMLIRRLAALPRKVRFALIGFLFAGAADMTGAVDALLEALLAPDEVELHQPTRANRPDLRLERADGESLDGR